MHVSPLRLRCLGVRWLAALLLLCSAAGCGPGGPEVVPVTGRVTRAGEPVANLTVNFKPDEGRPSWGMTDANGNFELNYTRQQDGAVTGWHTIWFVYAALTPAQEMEVATGDYSPPPELAEILEKYGKEETTTLRVEIVESGQDVKLELD